MSWRTLLVLLVIPLVALSLEGCRWGRGKKAAKKDYARQLEPGERALVEVDAERLPALTLTASDRAAMQRALDHSLAFLKRPGSARFFPIADITREQTEKSVRALRELLDSAGDDAALNSAIRAKFRVLMSVGWDGQGGVLFTGYCTPIYDGSLTPDERFKYPLHKRPADLVTGVGDAVAQQRLADGTTRPYPARAELERSGALRGLELVYFADPFEAYIVQVQGSGRVRLPDGRVIEVGYDGTNNHTYHPIAEDLIADGKMTKETLSLATMRAYFRQHPQDVPVYAARNPRYIFFTITKGGPYGSIGQPVTADVSVATDKTIFPPGAPVVVQTLLADAQGGDRNYAALRVDQDTGGAIRAPGRCDLYMGIGDEAEARAGHQMAEGRLFYLILRE